MIGHEVAIFKLDQSKVSNYDLCSFEVCSLTNLNADSDEGLLRYVYNFNWSKVTIYIVWLFRME